MILVGILYEEGNIAMTTMAYKQTVHRYFRLEEADNIHEAAKLVWECFHPRHPLSVREYIKSEMHDTETDKTWSVDKNGHTLKDYRKEHSLHFRRRYMPAK